MDLKTQALAVAEALGHPEVRKASWHFRGERDGKYAFENVITGEWLFV